MFYRIKFILNIREMLYFCLFLLFLKWVFHNFNFNKFFNCCKNVCSCYRRYCFFLLLINFCFFVVINNTIVVNTKKLIKKFLLIFFIRFFFVVLNILSFLFVTISFFRNFSTKSIIIVLLIAYWLSMFQLNIFSIIRCISLLN